MLPKLESYEVLDDEEIIVSLVSALTLLVPTQVLAEDWMPVDRRVLVDADSVTVNRRNINIRYSSEIFQWNRPGFLLVYRVSDCASRRTKILEKITYNNVGKVIYKSSVKNRGKYATPGSIKSRILNFICK